MENKLLDPIYIQSENKKGKNLFGGIATNTDQRDIKDDGFILIKLRANSKITISVIGKI